MRDTFAKRSGVGGGVGGGGARQSILHLSLFIREGLGGLGGFGLGEEGKI